MQSDEIFKKQKEWSEKSLFLMRDLLPLMAPIALYSEWTKEEQYTLGLLLSAVARSTESGLLLTAYGQLWDAEMPLRSALEGTLKFVYILQSKDSFKERINEFSNVMYEISLLKDDRKIREVLNAVSNPEADEWLPLRTCLMSQEEIDRITKKYEKNYKRSIESKWGFTGLIQSLSNGNDSLFKGFKGLSHGYSIASHIMHADYLGVILPMERDERESNRKDSIHFAHLHQLLSNTFACIKMRLYVGYRFVGADLLPIEEAFKKIDDHLEIIGKAYNEWMKIEYGIDNTE